MAKNEIPKISDFPYLGLCYGFAKVLQNIQFASVKTFIFWLPPKESRMRFVGRAPGRAGTRAPALDLPRARGAGVGVGAAICTAHGAPQIVTISRTV